MESSVSDTDWYCGVYGANTGAFLCEKATFHLLVKDG